MTRRSLSLLLGVALLSLSLFAALPAQAAEACDFTAEPQLNVTLGSGDTVTIVRAAGPTVDPEDDVLVVGAGAGDCTQPLAFVENVIVTGATGDETLAFSLAGGLLENPNTFTESGRDIEFQVDLGAGDDTIDVVGGAANDEVRLGAEGINLNGDGDADVAGTFTANEGTSIPVGVENYTAHLGDGPDFISGGGASGTDADFPLPLVIFGEDGDDDLNGGAGDDVFDGGLGADVMDGHGGTDTADYSTRTGGVSLSNDALHQGDPNDGLGNDGEGAGCFPDLVDGEYVWDYSLGGDVETNCENDHVRLNVENLRGGSGDDFLFGNTDANMLEGLAGLDTLVGGGAADVLNGGANADDESGESGSDTFMQEDGANGADQMNGGTGSDTADYSGRTAPVTVDLSVANDDGQSGENDNVMPNVERLRGGSDNDTLLANDGPDVLFGNDGNDLLQGMDGNDKVIGGLGNDDERGNAANDVFFQGSSYDGDDSVLGGAGTDSLKYASFSGVPRTNRVVVDVDGARDDGEPASNEDDNVRTDVEKVYGGNGNDSITGNAAASSLFGGDGDDTLLGRDGLDHLFGNAGNDVANGGGGSDEVHGGSGDDDLLGGAGRDRLFGDDGGDTLNGGDGDADYCDVGPGGTSKINCERPL